MKKGVKLQLVLLPGLLCDAALWEPQLSELADVARFWVPDLTEYETMAEMGESVLLDALAPYNSSPTPSPRPFRKGRGR